MMRNHTRNEHAHGEMYTWRDIYMEVSYASRNNQGNIHMKGTYTRGRDTYKRTYTRRGHTEGGTYTQRDYTWRQYTNEETTKQKT